MNPGAVTSLPQTTKAVFSCCGSGTIISGPVRYRTRECDPMPPTIDRWVLVHHWQCRVQWDHEGSWYTTTDEAGPFDWDSQDEARRRWPEGFVECFHPNEGERGTWTLHSRIYHEPARGPRFVITAPKLEPNAPAWTRRIPVPLRHILAPSLATRRGPEAYTSTTGAHKPRVALGELPWASWWQKRCRAVKEPGMAYHGRCELQAGHAGDHALERGFDIPRWSTNWTDIQTDPLAPVPPPTHQIF